MSRLASRGPHIDPDQCIEFFNGIMRLFAGCWIWISNRKPPRKLLIANFKMMHSPCVSKEIHCRKRWTCPLFRCAPLPLGMQMITVSHYDQYPRPLRVYNIVDGEALTIQRKRNAHPSITSHTFHTRAPAADVCSETNPETPWVSTWALFD